MNFRYKFSLVLIILGILSAIMSFGGKKSFSLSPEEILAIMTNEEYSFSADELAEMLVEEDSGIQVVDVRSPEEYKSMSIPGAISIPFPQLLQEEYSPILVTETQKTVFYSADENLSTLAWILSMQKGYSNLYILEGGLNEWDSLIMRSSFQGEKITSQENTLFEKRYKARRLFTSWNAMPDSLKAGFFAAKQKKDKELVGGCE